MGFQKVVAVLCILAATAATTVGGQTDETNSSYTEEKNTFRMCTTSELQVDSMQADYTWTVAGVPKLLNATRLMTYDTEFVTNTTDVELFDGLYGTWYFTIHKCRYSNQIHFDVNLKSQHRMNYTVKVDMALTVGDRSVNPGEAEYSSKVRTVSEPTGPMALMESMGLMFNPNNNDSKIEEDTTPVTVHRWRTGGPVYSFVGLFKPYRAGEDEAMILTYKISIVRPTIIEGSLAEGEDCSDSPTFDEVKQAQELKMQNPYYYYSTSAPSNNYYRSYSTVGPNYNYNRYNQHSTQSYPNRYYSTPAPSYNNRYYTTSAYNNRYYSSPAYNFNRDYHTTPRY